MSHPQTIISQPLKIVSLGQLPHPHKLKPVMKVQVSHNKNFQLSTARKHLFFSIQKMHLDSWKLKGKKNPLGHQVKDWSLRYNS